VLRDVAPTSAIASSSLSVSAVELPQPLAASEIRRLNTSGGVAGAPVGSTRVYGNDINPITTYWVPGTNQRMADDLTLANGPCNLVYYNLAVFAPSGAYNIHTELWTDDPCLPGATAIADTAADFNVPNNPVDVYLLEAEITGSAIPIPETVWLAATFSTDNSGWIIAQQAEIGSTGNLYSENDTERNPDVCGQFFFTCNPTYLGFWAEIFCETTVPPDGACCNGTNCSQTTQTNCLSPSVWQGAFTTCQPNACLTGACCTGVDFENCSDTNEPGCSDGLFRPGTICLNNPCGLNVEVYENDFCTGKFSTIDTNTKFGDDLTLGAGAPCQLTAYELLMRGGQRCVSGRCEITIDPCSVSSPCPPAPPFNARVELWTNNDRGTPAVDGDDTPLTVIPGTARDFNGLRADFTIQRLLVGPFTGIQLPPKVWMVVTTSKDYAGPIFGGLADIGFSQDSYAIFNDPSGPNAWTFWDLGGFNPTGCPLGADCTPAGSFRAIVWCEGAPSPGACCNDVSGTCTDGVLSTACEGRWMQDVTCDSNPFDPPCGAHACCFPNPVNPSSIVCLDLTPEECAGPKYEGSSAPGLFCVDVTCPARACINKPGDCFTGHGTGGCDNAFCCDKVCAADPFCCTSDWDSTCVTRALTLCSSDHCGDALPITGTGTFAFDNTTATTDGPVHAACATIDGPEKQIQKDVWYCWTASCTDTVFVRTCGQTTVDTKLAVYDGCACPPTDAALLDCGDDRCGAAQSTAVFHAVAGRSYLIRLGNYPGLAPGTGSFTISCGPPNQLACPGTGGCCTAELPPVRGCVDEACCERVCGCDSFCCDTRWDEDCAARGYLNNGCGADVLCPALCGACSAGTVTFNSPTPGILDAGRPYPPGDATQLLGIDTIQVTAPAGANLLGCWSVCETASNGPANGIAGITDNGGGQFTIQLARPITTGAVTKITYAGNLLMFARYIAHPANLNVDGFANTTDVQALVNALNGGTPLPVGLLSGDVDRSGAVTAADILDLVGLLNGEGAYAIWNNTAKPAPNVNCP
jgi:hypothetical protein